MPVILILKGMKAFIDTLEKRYPQQSEFLQAVTEVAEDVQEVYRDHEDYRKLNILERMAEPDRMIHFRVTWEADDGSIHVNRAWRVQFNNALGAYKGGLRFHPTVNASILKFLGFEQCFKNALTGLPMGGAKGGSDFDPKGKSDAEIRRFCQALMDELHHYIGENRDVPAGDIGAGSREIGFLFGHYIKLTQQFTGVLTGKRPIFGGSCGREEATGYGAVYFLEEMLHAHDDELKGKKVIISGAGNVALHAAEKCMHKQAKVLCLSDSTGVLVFKDGLNEKQLEKIKKQKFNGGGSLKEFSFGEFHKGKKPWHLEADIAMPCATQNDINKDDAKTLIKNGITIVVEGANMPLTAKAQDVIAAKDVLYAPGKAANAGGVAVSGLERTQNASMVSWPLDKVEQELQQIMKDIHHRCTEHIHKTNGVYHYKRGANIASFRKLADALVAYGVK